MVAQFASSGKTKAGNISKMEKMKIDENKLRDLLCVGEDVIHDFEKCDEWVKDRFRPVFVNGDIKCVSIDDKLNNHFIYPYIFDCPKIHSNGLLYTVSLLAKCKVEK